MTAETVPSIRMRRTSIAAVSIRRNSNRFWTDTLNELENLALSNRPLTFCEEMAKSPATPLSFYQPTGQPKQAVIDGEVWPPIFEAVNVRSAKQMKPRSTDVFVCTYPKCGTTWMQHICSQLIHSGYGPEKGQVPELAKTSPMLEKVGADTVEGLKSPRLIKTHLNHYNCPMNTEAKYIFVARNPKDCLTSYYFHNRNFKIYNWADGDFDVFFELFASGQLAFGDYYDHLLSWLPHINDPNVFFITYEDMYEDLEAAVLKIGQFLGGRAAEIVADTEQLEKVVNESTIDAMKQNQSRWFPSGHLCKETFIRKGGSRDWKNYMNREQSDRLDAIWHTRMAGSTAERWWKYEMAWEEEGILLIPEIVLTTEDEDGTESESEEPLVSVSRRSSIYTITPYIPSRRNSIDSISSGYGSVWSKIHQRRPSPDSRRSSIGE